MVAGCALLVALASVPSPAEAAYPGSNGKVAFVRANQIWTVNADGTGEVQLTSAVAPSADPQWSPNGTRILYTRGSIDGPEVRVMNADGTGDTQVSPPVQSGTVSPTWSPDGSRVAIVERLTEGTGCGCPVDRIVLVDPDGSRRENHSEGVGDSDRGFGPVGGLQWSPKGNELIFHNGGAGEMRIYIRGVPPGSAEMFAGGGVDVDFFGPAWSPDAERVAYLRYDDAVGDTELYVRNRDGSGLTQVPVASTPWAVEWAPDGTKLIVARSGNLFVMDPDGSDEVPLLTTPSGGSNPDWQPLPGAPYQGYPRPKGATPLRIPLVPAFQPCSAPDRTHGPPLAFGSCASPALVSSRLTVGTPDANGAPANSVGHIELTVAVGNPATLATEADISIRVSITDVRCAHGLCVLRLRAR